jgi:hypothetical protein
MEDGMNDGAKERPIETTGRKRGPASAKGRASASLALHRGGAASAPADLRRIVDDCGRSWTVREFAALTIGEAVGGETLLRVSGFHFRCEQPGQLSQLRRAWLPLAALSDDDLLAMIQRQDD